ncbi:AAA family ATPase [Euzebya tangerina]|uniref:AAA family ATPase n=1 Tax=Euzebya tangerina TaxID=591198 RepID=UPI0013C35B53|nr:MoxR family ATPase [Euzebya tangerina]
MTIKKQPDLPMLDVMHPGVSAPVQSSTSSQSSGTASPSRALIDHVQQVVVGKQPVVELAVTTLLAGGHLLIEDVPGVGKTVLARALARSVGATESRVQGAPDLLPTDLTGSSVWRPGGADGDGSFEFIPGPLFANVVLVDEANRMSPRTQAALLEAMEEGQVSTDGVTRALPQPHIVIATQNPSEHQGTYPLPDAQLDRFTAATSIGYPEPAHEARIITDQLRATPISGLGALMDLHQLAALQADVRQVTATPDLVDYVVRLVAGSRVLPGIAQGASPRAGLQLTRMAQARALVAGRSHVLPDDVKALAEPVLCHRLIPHNETTSPADAIRDLVARTAVTG